MCKIMLRFVSLSQETATVFAEQPFLLSNRFVSGNPCTVNFEDIQLTTTEPWICANVNVHVTGTTNPRMPVCPFGPNLVSMKPTSFMMNPLDLFWSIFGG